MDGKIQKISKVAATLTESVNPDEVAKGAEILKLVAEIENQRAQTKKAEDELEDSTKRKKNWTEFAAILAPVVTACVLAGTLFLQSYQFSRTERDKANDAKQQRLLTEAQAKQQAEVAEDASWTDALKLLSSSEKLSPAAVLLKRFSVSPRYAVEARRTAIELLATRIAEPQSFQDLFASVFEPVSWENISEVLDIDRQLYQKERPFLAKAWGSGAGTGGRGLAAFTAVEKAQYASLDSELGYISEKVALLLKSRRPPSQKLSLRSVAIWNTDLQGADLSGADLSDGNFGGLNLRGANLKDVSQFSNGPNFYLSAWWEASAISPELRGYLEKNWPLNLEGTYANGRKISQQEYQQNLARLKSSS